MAVTRGGRGKGYATEDIGRENAEQREVPVEVEKGTELVVHCILLISKTETCQGGSVYTINTHSAMSNSTTPYKACPLYYDQASVTYTNIHVHSSGAKKLRAHTQSILRDRFSDAT